MVAFASQGVGAALNPGPVLHGLTLCYKVLCRNNLVVRIVLGRLQKRSGELNVQPYGCTSKESEEALNQLFRALADGTRRDILARSLTETPSVSALAARYEMSFAAVQKHVAVLERAGLIQKRANGREQLVSTNHARLQRAGELLDYFESIWRQRMAQLDDVLLPKGK